MATGLPGEMGPREASRTLRCKSVNSHRGDGTSKKGGMVADEHPAVSRRDPLVWLGAGVVTLGVGTALLSGAGVATADTGSSPTNSHTTNATEKSAPTDPPGSRSGRGVARPTAGITGTPKTAGATRTAQRPTALSSRKRDTPRWQATSLAVATSLGAAKPGADAVTTVASATAAASPWDTITGAVNGFVSGVKKFVDDTVVAVSNTVRATSVVALGAVIPRLSVIPGLSQLVDAVAQLGPSTPASRLYRTLRYLTATDADGIVVNTITGADNQKRLVVYLGGTVPFSSTNQPAVDNLVGWNGSAKTNQLNVVLTALQGDKTKPVIWWATARAEWRPEPRAGPRGYGVQREGGRRVRIAYRPHSRHRVRIRVSRRHPRPGGRPATGRRVGRTRPSVHRDLVQRTQPRFRKSQCPRPNHHL